MCHAFVGEIVSLSHLRSKNLNLKKVNKSFVPEPISCFSDSYMRMNICERFQYLYEYVYFTYSYLGPILNILVVFLDVYILHMDMLQCINTEFLG